MYIMQWYKFEEDITMYFKKWLKRKENTQLDMAYS